jgi:hypothetical protein
MSAHELDENGTCITCRQADRMYFRAASGGRVPEQTARAAVGRGSRGGAGTTLGGERAPGDPTSALAANRNPLPAESVRGFAYIFVAAPLAWLALIAWAVWSLVH